MLSAYMYFCRTMKTCLAILLLLFALNTGAQDFKKHIVFLTSDSLHGRAPGTGDEVKAARYIHDQLQALKCMVRYQSFVFRDSSRVIPAGYGVRDTAVNVAAYMPFGHGNVIINDSTIIISAHYDHLGFGSNKSLDIGKKGIHPGADDNASGVALMLELAKWIYANKGWKYNFVFVAYSGHEAGLYGSDYFSKTDICKRLKKRAVINFDMEGRLDSATKVLRVSGAGTDSVFYRVFHSLDGQPLHFNYDDENIPHSDLKPFIAENVPLLNLTTGTHDDYHRITDTEDKINYPGMQQIFLLMQQMLTAVGR
jgi:Zn-dependent M28 family amino/carboxypeptidase